MRFTRPVLVMLLALPVSAGAQGVPGTRLTVDVNVTDIGKNGDTSRVVYVLHNRSGSLERVVGFTVEAPAEPIQISSPVPRTSWGTSMRYGDRPVARWDALNDSILQPGTSSQQLWFRALGLPTIVDAHVEGDYELPNMNELSDAEVDSLLATDPLITNDVALRVVGIEPLPGNTSATSLTARLDSLTRESCALRWITRASLCTTLRGHLTARPARLVSFRRVLAAGHKSGGPVTSNAYWLLKVNADYLLSLTSTPAPAHPRP